MTNLLVRLRRLAITAEDEADENSSYFDMLHAIKQHPQVRKIEVSPYAVDITPKAGISSRALRNTLVQHLAEHHPQFGATYPIDFSKPNTKFGNLLGNDLRNSVGIHPEQGDKSNSLYSKEAQRRYPVKPIARAANGFFPLRGKTHMQQVGVDETYSKGLAGRLEEHYTPVLQNASKQQKLAMNRYLGNGDYESWNAALRHTPPDPEQKHVESTKHLDELLHTGQTPEDMTLFRGIEKNSKVKYEAGKTYRKRGYTSTSTHPSTAKDFGGSRGSILQIHVPKGHPGLFQPGMENEFLLPRDTHLQVSHVEQQPMGNIHVHAHVVPPPKPYSEEENQVVQSCNWYEQFNRSRS